MYVVLMNLLDLFSSSSSEETHAADDFLLKARGKRTEGDEESEDDHSISSKQDVDMESSPIQASDDHVSTIGHIHPVAPEHMVNYL